MILYVSGITFQQVPREILFTKYEKSTKKQYIQCVVSEMHKNIIKVTQN